MCCCCMRCIIVWIKFQAVYKGPMSKIKTHMTTQHAFWVQIRSKHTLAFSIPLTFRLTVNFEALLLIIHTCFYVFTACSTAWPCSDCYLCCRPLSAPQPRAKTRHNCVYAQCGLFFSFCVLYQPFSHLS